MSKEKIGYLFGILAALLWGTHAVIVRHMTADIPGIPIGILRLLGAGLVLFLFLKATKKKINWKISNKKWFLIIVLFGLGINFLLFHLGLEFTTASSAILLENTAPIFVLLFLVFFMKEKVSKKSILAVFITFLGVLFVVMKEGLTFKDMNLHRLTGDTLELLAGLTFAIFMIGSSKVFVNVKSTSERLVNLMKIFVVSGILFSPLIFVYTYSFSITDIWWLLFLILLPTTFAYVLWYESAARISTIAAALLFNLAIFFTVIFEYIFLEQVIDYPTIIGGVLIITGVTITKSPKKQLNSG